MRTATERSDGDQPLWTIDPGTRATTGSADGRVLMHLESGRVSAVNGIGSDIWGHLEAGRNVPAIVSALAADYDVPPERITQDVSTFLQALEAKGFVHPPRAVRPRPIAPRRWWRDRGVAFGETGTRVVEAADALPAAANTGAGHVLAHGDRIAPTATNGWRARLDTVEAFAALLAVDVALAVGGFRRLHHRIHDARVLGLAPPDVNATIAGVNAAIDRAAVWYPRHARCLPRSAAATWLLRRRGVPAAFVIGVRKLPFYAHAWVEVAGHVVNDVASVAQKYPAIEHC